MRQDNRPRDNVGKSGYLIPDGIEKTFKNVVLIINEIQFLQRQLPSPQERGRGEALNKNNGNKNFIRQNLGFACGERG